jgi:predicted peptidase
MGQTDSAKTLAALPVWAFVGVDDRDATVVNARAMVEGVNAAGGKAKLTEYLGVGHNSWDRAYNEPAHLDWMLAQKSR